MTDTTLTKQQKAADWLVYQLGIHGVLVQRYDAYSSNSIYLKLDYGVLGSIRISDHAGRKKLKYKYNLLEGVQRRVSRDKGIERVYCPYRDIQMMLDKILYDRGRLKMRYGRTKYVEFMRKNQHDNTYKKGFWEKSKIVQEVFVL